jgi:hypothetical protein
MAIAESVGLARPVTQLVKRGEAPSAPFLLCFVRPVVSCAILDDEWQRFTVRKVDTIEKDVSRDFRTLDWAERRPALRENGNQRTGLHSVRIADRGAIACRRVKRSAG